MLGGHYHQGALMTVKDLEGLYEYRYWANKKLFGVMSQLTPEEFVRPLAGSYGLIRNTMVHVLSAEWGWLERCGGAKRGARLDPGDYPTVESLIQTWNKVEMYVREFLCKLEDEDLVHNVKYTIYGTKGLSWWIRPTSFWRRISKSRKAREQCLGGLKSGFGVGCLNLTFGS